MVKVYTRKLLFFFALVIIYGFRIVFFFVLFQFLCLSMYSHTRTSFRFFETKDVFKGEM